MGYPWECSDCIWLDKSRQNWKGFWCPKMKIYVKADERSCNKYFERNIYCSAPNYEATEMNDIIGQEDICYVIEILNDLKENFMKLNEEYIPLAEEQDTTESKICENNYNNEQENYTPYLGIIEAINNNEYKMAIEIYKEQFLTKEKPKQKVRINE